MTPANTHEVYFTDIGDPEQLCVAVSREADMEIIELVAWRAGQGELARTAIDGPDGLIELARNLLSVALQLKGATT